MRRISKIGIVLGILLASAGCAPDDEIITHRVPRSRSGLEDLEKALNTDPPAPKPKNRMVAGMVSRPDATWFFKVNGAVDAVTEAEPGWREFFAKLSFEDSGQPKWELPAGWSDGGERKGMFTTVKLLNLNDQSPPLTMEISSMSANQPLKMNVDRWRGQLGLGDSDEENLGLKSLDYEGGQLMLFDEIGEFGGGMRAPFAGGAGGPAPGGPVNVPSQPIPDSGAAKAKPPAPINAPDHEVPPGWEVGKPSQIVKIRLQKQLDNLSAQLTVVELSAVNEWDVNAKEWANQIGFESFTDEAAAERTSEIEVSGMTAQKIRLIEAEDRFTRGILAVMFKRGDSAWFVKMAGDKTLVAANEEVFEAFLQSLKFSE